LIQADWRLSHAEGAAVFSAYLAGYAAAALLLLHLSDRYSPRRVLLLGAALAGVGNALFPLLATGVWTGALLRLMAGAGHVGAYVAGVQLVSLRFGPARRGRAVGAFVSAGYAGTTLSYVVMAELLRGTASWRAAYLVLSLSAVVGAALLALLPGGEECVERAGTGRRLDLSLLRDRRLALVNFAYALHTAELYIARLWLPLLLRAAFLERGMEPGRATVVAASLSGFMFMTGIAGAFLGGLLSDYRGRSSAAALLFAGSGLCSFAAGWLVGLPPWFLVGLGFLYGLLTASDSAIYSTLTVELAPPEKIGSAQAIQAFTGFGIGAAAPIAAGSLLDLMTGRAAWALAFSFNGALALLGVAALLRLNRVAGV
jgi:MFS family permease